MDTKKARFQAFPEAPRVGLQAACKSRGSLTPGQHGDSTCVHELRDLHDSGLRDERRVIDLGLVGKHMGVSVRRHGQVPLPDELPSRAHGTPRKWRSEIRR
jgi:hypothetical protein